MSGTSTDDLFVWMPFVHWEKAQKASLNFREPIMMTIIGATDLRCQHHRKGFEARRTFQGYLGRIRDRSWGYYDPILYFCEETLFLMKRVF